ncbi:MAG: hypothetical protein Q7J54_02730 [Candidatus Woesearchaeota archaeon]|nr:hypothetical protein [Candidatus Woesearchaeota archaeon]
MAWKGFSRFVVKLVFVIALFLTIFLVSFAQLTNKDAIKPVINDLLTVQLQQGIGDVNLNDAHAQLVQECGGKEAIEREFSGMDVSVNCAELNATPPSGLMNLLILSLFDSLYNKKYDCSLIECLVKPDKSNMLVLFNAATNAMFWKLFNIFLIVTIVFAVISVLIAEKWFKEVRSIGIRCLTIGATFFIIGFLTNLLLPKENAALLPVISKLSGNIAVDFIILVVIGAVLTVIGMIFIHLNKEKVK